MFVAKKWARPSRVTTINRILFSKSFALTKLGISSNKNVITAFFDPSEFNDHNNTFRSIADDVSRYCCSVPSNSCESFSNTVIEDL